MADINVFNSLATLRKANEALHQKLASMGDRADLHELRDIFERYGTSERVGVALLHKHFTIVAGERVVEFGHVSTPWPVPEDGHVSGGWVVPRSWRFMNHQLHAYEYGFNHPGQTDYDETELPKEFVSEVEQFLSETNLDDVLGLCAIGEAELTGRVEKSQGRVNFTVPLTGMEPGANGEVDVADSSPENLVSVWSFNCKSVLRDSKLKLARYCWVCPDDDH